MKYYGSYQGAEGRISAYDIQFLEGKKGPLVIFCHGFKGFKDWGVFDLMSDYFLDKGFNFVKLNFSHNGTTLESPSDFVDLEAFGNNNFEKELFDLDALIKQLKAEDFSKHLDFDKMFVVGHSKGGATALSYTLSHSKVISCATLAAVIDPISRYGKINDKRWKENGVKYVLNGRTNQEMPIYYQLAENTQLNRDRLDLRNLIKDDKRNFLFIHGSKDDAVSVSETNLVKNLKNCKTEIIENANHVFGAEHPFVLPSLPPDFELALNKITNFFKAQIS